MLDVVSRMQLARHLDESGNWEKVARKFRQQRLVDLGPSLGSPTCSLIDILAVKIRQFIVTQWSYYASQLLSLYILVGWRCRDGELQASVGRLETKWSRFDRRSFDGTLERSHCDFKSTLCVMKRFSSFVINRSSIIVLVTQAFRVHQFLSICLFFSFTFVCFSNNTVQVIITVVYYYWDSQVVFQLVSILVGHISCVRVDSSHKHYIFFFRVLERCWFTHVQYV